MTVDFDLTYKRQLQSEIEAPPDEYLPAPDSFRQGWLEAMSEQTFPVSELWQDFNAE